MISECLQCRIVIVLNCAVFYGVLENTFFENDVMMVVVTTVIVRFMLMTM